MEADHSNSCLKRREVVAYGVGDISSSLVWNAISAFALIFYTDVALLPAAALGTLFFVSRIFDGFFDVAVGLAVDRTRSRWGRARPYLLFGAVPFAAFATLTFWSPQADDTTRFVYAVVTYFIVGLLLSVVTIPYSALQPMMSLNRQDRVHLSSARAVCTAIGVTIATAVFLPGVNYFGGEDQRQGYLVMAAIISAAAALMLLITYKGCQERVHDSQPPSSDVVGDIKNMLNNRAWAVTSVFGLLNFIRFGALLALTPFFAIYVLGKPWMISVLLPTLAGTLLVGAFLASPLLTRFGYRLTDTCALIIAAISFAVLPLTEAKPLLFIAFYVLSSLAVSITLTSIFAMAAESVDFHEAKFGRRQEGLLAAGVSLAIKVGTAFGSAGVAYGLALGGYDPENVSEQARETITWIYYALPLGVFILQLICIQLYPEKLRHGNLTTF